ncbi:hypothetical protein CQW23_05054 [Capsicum baccatum]|uniref:NAC domain-containing protein n=1 Tax=Capsicum baccatum TaxID=33114 RepID=A0A2G2XGE8_CAPBA|nr:hypothetical protein CQW23_05054 [Capsicum baccatum]
MEKKGLGYRFHPTDSEGLTFLLRFVAKQEMHDSGFITTNIDVYGKQKPREIYSHGVPCADDDDSCYRYFITKKSNTTYHGEVGNTLGSWKQQDEGQPIHYNKGKSSSSTPVIGCKRRMRYMIKDHKDDGLWLMKEFELSNVILKRFDEDRRDYVLCAIKKKPIDTCPFEMNYDSDETDEVTCSNDNDNTMCRDLLMMFLFWKISRVLLSCAFLLYSLH